jgi:hypothetical protein
MLEFRPPRTTGMSWPVKGANGMTALQTWAVLCTKTTASEISLLQHQCS